MTVWMIRLINMSFAAGGAALVVMLLRLFLKKMPGSYSYALWFVVLFRFLCPVSFSSPYSLLPVHSEPIAQEIVYEHTPSVYTGIVWMDQVVNQVLEETQTASKAGSVNPIQITFFLLGVAWSVGVVICFSYSLYTYIRLRRRLSTAIRTAPGIYESDQVSGAFLLGIWNPRIYLPTGLEDDDRRHILQHESAHVKRGDHVVKLLWTFVVMLHWFNPIAWISFSLLCKDMEMACDEQVLNMLNQEERVSYSRTLLHAAERQSGLSLPLAFGESHTKARIENILHFRRPKTWIAVITWGILTLGAIGLVLSPEMVVAGNLAVIGGADGPTSIFIAGKQEAEPETISADLLSGTRIQRRMPEGNQKGTVTLDVATENMVIFHGEFGLFVFSKKDTAWSQDSYISPEYPDEIQAMVTALQENQEETESIHPEDRLVQKRETGERMLDYAATRMTDGKIALLGGPAGEDESCRLQDLFYGYYDPQEQVLYHVNLFK